MHPKGVVSCLPSRDLDVALDFYRRCFKLDLPEAEDDILTIELGNLSLFLMGRSAYEGYTKKAGLSAHLPEHSVQCLHSCAVSDRDMIEHVFATAESCGGTVAQPMRENEWGQQAGYVRDPDGHLWEIVQVEA